MSLRLILVLMILTHINLCDTVLGQQVSGFIYNGFVNAELRLDGNAKILPDGLLRLTNTSTQKIGHAFYKTAFRFGPLETVSFSTSFVFTMVPKGSTPDTGGHGIAFVVSKSTNFSHAVATQYLGLFNITTNGSPENGVLAIEFDTVLSPEFLETDKNHVGIDLNNLQSEYSAPASYVSKRDGKRRVLTMGGGDPIQVWIDYEGKSMRMNVTIAPKGDQRLEIPLLSKSVNLSGIFEDSMFVGFSASTGTVASDQYIHGWSFSNGRTAETLDLLKLPKVPSPKKTIPKTTILLVILLILFSITISAILLGFYIYNSKKYAEIREEWEKEYGPHRFSYKSLYKATKGFDKAAILGKGGFGEVYRGTLANNREIAVKKVSHDAEQGMKQFVAEIVSMGRLKHRNLVQLLGYCRRKGELLLVSEFMPNQSLDRYLFTDENPVLSWLCRFTIIKDIATALDYLHRGVNQVVLHRDIKASNVMLDSDYNGKLGDFGMAQFHEHGTEPQPSGAVGTIGYMAPELSTMGASTRTDVFAFGVFMLEVACGRRPVEPEVPVGQRCLVRCVCQHWKDNGLVNARDPKFGMDFPVREVEMVLKLGLLCSNFIPEARPTMEEVVRYLNRNTDLPDFSPDTPGIGIYVPMADPLTEFRSTSRNLSGPSNYSSDNNSMFVSHTIFYGDGR